MAQIAQGEAMLSPLSDSEADAIVAREVARSEKAEAEHIANSVAFTVLERREVDLGDRKLITNRVSDPKLPKVKARKSPQSSSNRALRSKCGRRSDY